MSRMVSCLVACLIIPFASLDAAALPFPVTQPRVAAACDSILIPAS